MIRKLRTAALLLTGTGVLGLGLAAGPASAASEAVHPAVTCVSATPIMVDGFAFTPAEVKPGESSTADLVTTNCTNTSVEAAQEWTGQWLTPTGTGPAPGCPVIDPRSIDVVYAPGATVAENTVYTVPAGCTATELAVTVKIYLPAGSVNSVVTATAYLRIDQITPAAAARR